MAADFARLGWSLTGDVGDRLRYGDAIALHAALLSDTGSMTGAKHNEFRYPMPWGEYLRLLHDPNIPDGLLPYRPPALGPSDEETRRAGEEAMNEMRIGG